jgi:transposase InsO family protein
LWIGLSYSKYSNWKLRYGKANEHNRLVPRDHWLEEWEKQAIIEFGRDHPLEGYRRCAFMMMDLDLVAASPATVYRVMKEAGLLRRWNGKRSTKGTGFEQPITAHEHWHIDISYINICGTFYYLCSLLDGYSRYIVHWELREQMKESDVEMIIERAKERFPQARPRIISDNGPQFIARDFKEYIRISGMSHVRTSPYYPQSNGKIERWHKTLKTNCIRTKTPLTLEEARRVVSEFVEHYNGVRLHSSIGYVAPKDKLEGKAGQIQTERDRKLEEARELRRIRRQGARQSKDRLEALWAAGLREHT